LYIKLTILKDKDKEKKKTEWMKNMRDLKLTVIEIKKCLNQK